MLVGFVTKTEHLQTKEKFSIKKFDFVWQPLMHEHLAYSVLWVGLLSYQCQHLIYLYISKNQQNNLIILNSVAVSPIV